MTEGPAQGNGQPAASRGGSWDPAAWAPTPATAAALEPPAPPAAQRQDDGPDIVQLPGVAPLPGVATQPAPSAAPAPAPRPSYADYPQPAYQPPSFYSPPAVPPRKGLPGWAWLTIAGGTAVVVMAGVAAVTFVGQKTKAFSPNYVGVPVESTDASDLTIVSDTATVAYDIGADWTDAADYFDVEGAGGDMVEGQSIVGGHFTADPATATPQYVMVMEQSPELGALGTLEDDMVAYLDGLQGSDVAFATPQPERYITASGLQGYSAHFDATIGGTPATLEAVVLGHGRRVVIVQWMSYSGPVDEVSLETMLSSLRIDD